MKKVYSVLLIIFSLFFSLNIAKANIVIVKGNVTFANGTVASNWPVTIMPDSATTAPACMQYHVKYTNPNGYYIDTLYCTSNDITRVRISVRDCNNNLIVHDPAVGTTNVVESNFSICSPTTTCHADFSFQASGLIGYFTSSASTASTGATITERSWSFGDGTGLGGNQVSVSHTYAAGGTYTVRLIISTSSGCRDTVMKTITLTGAATGCHASFSDSVIGQNGYFYSGGSTTISGDSIVERHWFFGDFNNPNNSLGGNVVNPVHTYTYNGTFTACLTIYSARGCVDSICKTVTVNSTVASCSPAYTFTKNGYTVNFNSSTSQAGANDQIIKRTWYWGNGDTLGGNVISPVRTFASVGNYSVCLRIYTAAGCTKQYCQTITISDTSCHSAFSFTPSTANPHLINFNSSSSTGSGGTAITTRMWNFGDGDSLTGNVISPQHTYANAGTYTVCLTIYAANGCHSTECKTVTIANTGLTCTAYFIDSAGGNKGYFYSGYSVAGQGDSIINRFWNFGDPNSLNNTLGGNVVNPVHEYASNGTYTVCLKTVSARGCVDSICKAITINYNANQCYAAYTFTKAGLSVAFNSSGSSTSPAYAITGRKWKFGNGDSLTGNVVSPTYNYSSSGTYNVCLTIYTSGGCTNTYCQQISVNIDTICKAGFNTVAAQSNPYYIYFSSTSTAGAGSVINSYKWKFGDGDTLTGNAAATHTYANAGTYNACLTIKTSAGCENTTCKQVVIATPATCHAAFTSTVGTATPNGTPVNFNSSGSQGDSIITRTWMWGDGTALSGNHIDPIHTYFQAGTYTVCLKITTYRGCSDSICHTIQIAPAVQCHADFSSTQQSANPISVIFNSSNSTASTGSTIISRTWSFGDGDSLSGNNIQPAHNYAAAGTYTVCLRIMTSDSCINTTCKTITVTGTHCHSRFTYNVGAPSSTGTEVHFSSTTSEAVSGDSIITRSWSFGDGTFLTGNNVSPTHVYTVSGSYTVCLFIQTAQGCSDSSCTTIQVSPQPLHCTAYFTFSPTGTSVKFQSNMSVAEAADTIVTRLWSFGDGTSLSGNNIDPVHQYQQAGLYHVCLTIVTSKGCRSTICKDVAITTTNVQCLAQFASTKLAPRKVLFNSTTSWAPINDSIVEHRWNFGDGMWLYGNVVSPSHEYINSGIYTVCLRIKTMKGCVSEFCSTVRISDSTGTTPDSAANIKIVSLYPNPAGAQMSTVVWSKNTNIPAELAIIDIYGSKRWSMNKILLNGYNVTVIPTGFLPAGPFSFRVTTQYGILSKKFYKL